MKACLWNRSESRSAQCAQSRRNSKEKRVKNRRKYAFRTTRSSLHSSFLAITIDAILIPFRRSFARERYSGMMDFAAMRGIITAQNRRVNLSIIFVEIGEQSTRMDGLGIHPRLWFSLFSRVRITQSSNFSEHFSLKVLAQKIFQTFQRSLVHFSFNAVRGFQRE